MTIQKHYERYFYREIKQYARPVFFTGRFKDFILENYDKKNMCIKQIKHFFNTLHRNVFSRKSKKKITRLVILEHVANTHTHIALDVPLHLSYTQFKNELVSAWERCNGINAHLRVIDDVDRTAFYMTKYCDEHLSDRQTDFDNSNTYFKTLLS